MQKSFVYSEITELTELTELTDLTDLTDLTELTGLAHLTDPNNEISYIPDYNIGHVSDQSDNEDRNDINDVNSENENTNDINNTKEMDDDTEEMSLNDLIDSIKAKELSHYTNTTTTKKKSQDNDQKDSELTTSDNRDNKDNSNEQRKTIPILNKIKIVPKPQPFKSNRIDNRSEKYYVKRSYHDQYLLEKIWFFLGNRKLTDEILISPEHLENSDIFQEPAYNMRHNAVELENHRGKFGDIENINSQINDLDNSESLPAEEKAVEEKAAEEKGDKDVTEEKSKDVKEDREDKEDEFEKIYQNVTVYQLDNHSYILPCSQNGIPGAFWGSGDNVDFQQRAIEAIEIFRLPWWKEEEYSYKLVFSEKTFLLTTLMTKNGPRELNEVLPCGLEILSCDFVRIQC